MKLKWDQDHRDPDDINLYDMDAQGPRGPTRLVGWVQPSHEYRGMYQIRIGWDDDEDLENYNHASWRKAMRELRLQYRLFRLAGGRFGNESNIR